MIRLVIFILCFQVSGLASALGAAARADEQVTVKVETKVVPAPKPQPTPEELEARKKAKAAADQRDRERKAVARGDQQFERELQVLLLQLLSPDNLLTHKQDHATEEKALDKVETDYLTWKASFEKILAYSSNLEDRPAYDLTVKALAINDCAGLMQALVQARILLGKPPERETDGVRIPLSILGELSGYNQVPDYDKLKMVQAMLTDPSSPITADLSAVRSVDPSEDALVSLKLGAMYVQTMVERAKASQSSEENAMRALKQLSVTTLFSRMLTIDHLRKVPLHKLPQLPAGIERELGPYYADLFRRRAAEAETLAQEPDFRNELALKFPNAIQVPDQPNSPANPTPASPTPAKTDGPEAALPPEVAALVEQQWARDQEQGLTFANDEYLDQLGRLASDAQHPLNDAVYAQIKQRVKEAEVLLFPLFLFETLQSFPLSFLDADDALRDSALRLAVVKARFRAASVNLSKIDFSHGDLAAITSFTHAALDKLQAAIPESLIQNWWKSAQASFQSGFIQKNRDQSVAALVKEAHRIDGSFRLAPEQLPIDHEALERLVKAVMMSAGASTSATEIVDAALQAPKNSLTIDTFDRAILLMNQVPQKKPDMTPDERKSLAADQALIGKLRLMLSPRDSLKDEPETIGQLSLAPTQLQFYVDAVRGGALGHSFLAMKIKGERRMYEELVDADNHHDDARIESLLESGLEQLWSKNLEDLNWLATATPEKFAQLGSSSPLLHEMLDDEFPMFTSYNDAIRDLSMAELARRSTVDGTIKSYSAPMNFFLILFLAITAKGIASRFSTTFATSGAAFAISRLEASIMPHLGAYMVIGGAASVYKLFGVERAQANAARDERQLDQNFFYTSATAHSFFEYFNLVDAQIKENMTEKQFDRQAVLLLAFLGTSFFAGESFKIYGDLQEAWRMRQIKLIGFESGELPSLAPDKAETEIAARAEQTIQRIRSEPLPTLSGGPTVQEVESARDSLIKMLNVEQRQATTFGTKLRSSYAALHMKPSLDLAKVRAARQTMDDLYLEGMISKTQWERAYKASEELERVVKSSFDSIKPSFTRRAYRGGRDFVGRKLGWSPSAANDEVRARLVGEFQGMRMDANTGKGSVKLDTDYYAVLGLDHNATEKEIISAARKLSIKYHPDFNPGDPAAEEKFKEVWAARNALIAKPVQRMVDEAQ